MLHHWYTADMFNSLCDDIGQKNAMPPGGHVFQPTRTIFKLIQYIFRMNLLTNVKKEKCPAPCWPCFQATGTIFIDMIVTNFLTKFHDDRTINVASGVLTRKNAPPPWRPDIIGTNLLTKFHEDRTINVASRVKNAPTPGGHVLKATETIFKLVQDIIGTNLQTKVLTRKNAPPPGGHFHEDLTINVASRVLIRKNAPPLGSHVFQANLTIFELIQVIIETNLLTKQMLTQHNSRRTTEDEQKAITKAHHEHIVHW
ncbi:hypothetical protein DPMN_099474 [Dreissena polymorpha]|uniref:Uncharacterized protein n=1 Tax=Dreissena polymorpha TaxID=45954 RepID=A0A9D4LFJ2_DREPO|nr:hypothetical protein DPMN_099474 [Dreissena polymorpha]